MRDANLPVPVETLLAHEGWVRALARSLVLDDATADDDQVPGDAAVSGVPSPRPQPQTTIANDSLFVEVWFAGAAARASSRSPSSSSRSSRARRTSRIPSSK